MNRNQTMTDLPEFVLDREFDAPRELVWRAWTDPTYLQRWYGPGVETVIHKFELEPEGVWLNEMKMKNGSNFQKAPGVETVIHKFELEPEGVWLNEMKMKNGSSFQKAIFKEVTKPEKLVWHHCSTDSDWNTAANLMMPDWPRILLTTVTFAQSGDKTNVRLSQIPLDATDVEIACFAKMKDGMSGGWGGGYAIIDDVLAELKAG